MSTIIDDPRTVQAVKNWRLREGQRLHIGSRTSGALLGALGADESVAWLGPCDFVQRGEPGLVAITSRGRLVVGAKEGATSYRRRHVKVELEARSNIRIRLEGATGAIWVMVPGLHAEVLESLNDAPEPAGRTAPNSPRMGAPGDDSGQAGRVRIGDWRDAEQFAATHMRAIGFSDAAVTRAGADGGVDVYARGAVAQVKRHGSAPIGRPVVQQIRGAASPGVKVLCYSRSGFTSEAVGFAQQSDVALFVYDDHGNVTAVSTVAAALLVAQDREGVAVDDIVQASLHAQRIYDAAMTAFRIKTDGAMSRIPHMRSKRKQREALSTVTRALGVVSQIAAEVESRDMPLREVVELCAKIDRLASDLDRGIK